MDTISAPTAGFADLQTDQEFALLLSCSRVVSRPEAVLRQQALAKVVDTQRFLGLLDRHRVVSMAWHNLRQHPQGTFDPALMQALQQQHQKNTLYTLAMNRETVRIHRLLTHAGVPYCILKGLPVARKYYGDDSLRHSKDIDLFVPMSAFKDACQLLDHAGYMGEDPLQGLNQRQLAYYLQTAKDRELNCPNSDIEVELHWRIGRDLRMLSGVNLYEPGAKLVQQPFANCNLPMLADGEMLLYLCVHGAEHAWFRLKWLFDLPQLLEARAWDWPLLLKKASDYQCEDQLALGLLLAQRLLGWQAPLELEAWLHGRTRAARNYGFALKAIRGQESCWTTLPFIFRVRWEIYRTRFGDGWSNVLPVLYALATSRTDWKLLPLPNALFFLYFPLRPFLWGWRQVQRRLKNFVKPPAAAD